MDHSPPGSSVHGIFQARVVEWGAIAFSGNPQCRPQFTIHLCSYLVFMSTQECSFQLHTKLLATFTRMFFKDSSTRHFLVVPWLGFHASTARGLSLIPHQGTMTLQAAQPERKNDILTSKTIFIPEPCLLFCLYKQIAPHLSSCKAIKPMNHYP